MRIEGVAGGSSIEFSTPAVALGMWMRKGSKVGRRNQECIRVKDRCDPGESRVVGS